MKATETTVMLDPQLDANVLIGLSKNVTEFVSYAHAHSADGLTYNEATASEFLANGSATELQHLEQAHGIVRISDVSLTQINATGQLLERAFHGDSLGRIIHEYDARVAATAFIKNETLATGDLQLFKRGRDLGLQMEFIGSGPATAKALAYVPQLVGIPKQ